MASSAETVADIEELLKQILVCVPALSLIRFQCVSKHWLSLISDAAFRRRHTLRNPNPKITAFFSPQATNSITLGSPAGNPFKSLTNSASEFNILQSCNGLFLCNVEFPGENRRYPPVYVVNPTTNKFRAISPTSLVSKQNEYMFVRYGLAFDPMKSPHYNVVCVSHDIIHGKRHRIEIYSSETGAWGRSFKVPFFPSPSEEGRHFVTLRRPMHFDERSSEGAVYCNGAIHWIRNQCEATLPFCKVTNRNGVVETVGFARDELDVLHYFDIGEGSLRLAAVTPPVPQVVKDIPMMEGDMFPTVFAEFTHRYFGESGGGCLYLIEVFKHCRTQFEVMEMARDYSGWFVKYNVDISPVVAALPGQDPSAFVVLFLSGEVETDEEDSSTDLWLHIPGKVVTYNLKNRSFRTSELALDVDDEYESDDDDEYENDKYPYMETLACV